MSQHVEAVDRNKLRAKSASFWPYYTDILRRTVHKTSSSSRYNTLTEHGRTHFVLPVPNATPLTAALTLLRYHEKSYVNSTMGSILTTLNKSNQITVNYNNFFFSKQYFTTRFVLTYR
jgi:hypothetical protein